MPQEPNKALRLLVPAVAIGVGLLVVIAVGVRSGGPKGSSGTGAAQRASEAEGLDGPRGETQTPTNPQPQPSPSQTQPAPTPSGEGQVEAQPASNEPTEQPAAKAADATAAPALHVALVAPPTAGAFAPIGSDDPSGPFELRIEFTPEGAGVGSITLAKHYKTISRKEHYAVQERQTVAEPGGASVTVTSLAARLIEIDGQRIDLFASGRSDQWIWRQVEAERGRARFEAVIVDAAGAPAARIEREYRLAPGSFDVEVRQSLTNLTGSAMDVRWVQYGAVDLPAGDVGYGGDKRRVRFGALLSPSLDPSRQMVRSVESLGARSSVIGKSSAPRSKLVFPTPEQKAQGRELVWAGMTNRYFAFAVHSLPPEGANLAQPWSKALALGEEVSRVLVGPTDASGVMLLEHRTPALQLAPGAAASLDFGAYAGPLWRKTLGALPLYESVGLDQLVVFNFGGMCAFCTFQPLARGLLWFLGMAHDWLFHDWALAIIFLVLCVRGVLHPVTKRAQINMQRFSKRMQALAPKQQKLREKYADDSKRQQQEMAKLMKEEGINPAQALGCLPMFLQTPVWIALYAMLFFAFDLRHQQAFFGVFQAISGGQWSFLGDLSHPDRFIFFGKPLVTLPLMGPLDSLNLLPILLGVVFYAQQKYLTPPPSTAATPEQEQTQKIMRVMMVVMFPLIMYTAPSGLAIYFIANSTLGIIESRYIRAHISQMDLEPKKKPTPKPAAGSGARRKMREPANPFDKRWRDEDKSRFRDKRKKSR